jgi:hypothetical protein
MRRLIMLLAVSLAALVGASAAGAGVFPIFRCPHVSTSLNQTSPGQPITIYTTQDGSGRPTLPIRVKFGWAATSLRQVNDFLAVQYVPNAGTIYDTNGTVVWQSNPLSWAIGDTTPWSTPTYTSGLFTPGGHPTSGYVTSHSSSTQTTDASLAPGNYTLSLEWDINGRVLDGYTTAAPGSIISITSCPFTVSSQ